MKRSRAVARIIAVAIVVGMGSTAFADDTRYQDYPVGGRSVGLGGAFTALANDPSGVFFNPAGLVDQRRHSVQVSTNLYGLEISDSFFNAVGRVADLDTVFTELNIIPSVASFAGVIEADEDERPMTSYGFGFFVPNFRSTNVQTFSEVDPDTVGGTECGTVTYRRSLSDRTFMLGGAISHRVNDTWSLGMTLFTTYRSLRESENVACSAGPNRFTTASTDVNLAVANLLMRFGIKGRFGERWRFGATISTPSIKIADVAQVNVLRGSALEEGEPPEFFAREVTNLQANTRRNLELRAGGAYIFPKKATITMDVTFNAGVSYDLFRLPPGEEAVRAAITTSREIVRRPVVNFNVGGEYLIVRSFSVSSGFFTNFSSAPDIDGGIGRVFNTNRLPQIHTFGGSLVAGFFGEHTLTRVGVTMSYGEGTDVVPRLPGLAALGQPDEFVKVGLSQLFAFAFISSTFRY